MDQAILELINDDPRYAYEAYDFICDSVAYTQELLHREPSEYDDPETDYHISGEELLHGACDLAIQEFGMMAPVVFKFWGIRKTDDLGNIVFNLIKAKKLNKSERDDIADFHDLFDLQKALQENFSLILEDQPTEGHG